MSTYTSVRAIVRADVADAARAKAEASGKTLAVAIAELLETYATEAPKSRPKSRKSA